MPPVTASRVATPGGVAASRRTRALLAAALAAALAGSVLAHAGSAAAATGTDPPPVASTPQREAGEPVAPAEPPLVAPEAPVVAGSPSGWPQPTPPAAAAWLVLDATSGQVLSASTAADERRAVASTVKVLTALSVVRRTDLDDVVTVGAEVLGLEGASIGLVPGDQLTVEQLLLGLLIRSGNDAAETLAAHVGGDLAGFLALMRADAAALGLDVDGPDPLVLASPSGLGDANRLSAHDLAVLSRAALDDPDLRPLLAVAEVTLPRVGTDVNRNLLVGEYPGATGVKTGFTSLAGNSLIGSAARGGRELVVVVLDAGDDPARFAQAAALLDHGFDAYEAVTPGAAATLLLAGGRAELRTLSRPVTVPDGAQVGLELVPPIRVGPGAGPRARLQVDGTSVGELVTEVEVTVAPSAVDGAAAVGRGAADGVHAALRATLAAADPDGGRAGGRAGGEAGGSR